MKIIDLENSIPEGKTDVLTDSSKHKTRIIKLNSGDSIPECTMKDNVMFMVLDGEVDIYVNKDKSSIKKHFLAVIEPSVISMHSNTGALILGIQIK